MLIFNTTYHVEDNAHDEFFKHLTLIYIPKAVSSGFLHSPCFSCIRPQHEQSGKSYSLQLKVKNTDTLNHWLSTEGEQLHNEIVNKFGEKVVGFVTLMDEISL
ncbi:DUF4286 family protein [Dysgonomonas sp. 216]|uniref:DUF4286 family protein n=1 Tax=Dysgonomonas sp. 216 TaxID=2302934 RepID=UPI0013D7F4F0|nr:DUF4286 family protein [Dysgonomonas sp. 216]NDW17476.1 DUF4286 family protein [Dysgonomonas sp. 216]